MKNTLLIAALALAASPAMASKARLSALGNAAHLQDIQDIHSNAAKITEHGDWLTFEFGQTNTAGTVPSPSPRGEGGFTRSMGDSKYGLYLGAHPSWIETARVVSGATTSGTTVGLTDENPVELFFGSKAGDLGWGVGLLYSNSDKKTTKLKQSALGLNGGVSASNWDVGLTLGLMNTFKNDNVAPADRDFKGKLAGELLGTYTLDTMTFDAAYSMNGGKTTSNGVDTVDSEMTNYHVGITNSHKADGADFFYGARLAFANTKETVADTKTTTSELPVFAGIEADATSWMVLRASVTQNFLLGSTKTETAGTGDANTIANNTSVAAGAGLKFNKLMVDGTLEAATNGTTANTTGALNGNAFLANAAVTYMF
jgi:hypothetical protein